MMRLHKYTDRQIIYGLAGGQLVSIVILLFLVSYTIGRWKMFDASVSANTMNIRGIQQAIEGIGIRPQSVPPPKRPSIP